MVSCRPLNFSTKPWTRSATAPRSCSTFTVDVPVAVRSNVKPSMTFSKLLVERVTSTPLILITASEAAIVSLRPASASIDALNAKRESPWASVSVPALSPDTEILTAFAVPVSSADSTSWKPLPVSITPADTPASESLIAFARPCNVSLLLSITMLVVLSPTDSVIVPWPTLVLSRSANTSRDASAWALARLVTSTL